MIKINQVLRYPGSKHRLLPILLPRIKQGFGKSSRYVEPFFGGGAGLSVLAALPRSSRVWINDLDRGIFAIWMACKHHPEALIHGVHKIQPSIELFDQLKQKELAGEYGSSCVINALRKIALHRMSVSGFGSKSGGPLGGKNQNKISVGSRWNPYRIAEGIIRANRILWRFGRRIKITNLSALDVVRECRESDFIYLDPPYLQMGNQLYAHGMSESEHAELAKLVLGTTAKWLLSYDECIDIIFQYCECSIERVPITYSNGRAHGKRAQSVELLISP